MVQLVVAREDREGVTRCCSTGNGRKWRKAQTWRCADYKGEGEGGRYTSPTSIRKRFIRNSVRLRERRQPRGNVQCRRR